MGLHDGLYFNCYSKASRRKVKSFIMGLNHDVFAVIYIY
jgi:hypothetical protein